MPCLHSMMLCHKHGSSGFRYIIPIKECFTTFHAGSHGHVYLGNNHACSIEGIGTMHLIVDGTNELVLHDVRYVPSIKKSLCLLDKWI